MNVFLLWRLRLGAWSLGPWFVEAWGCQLGAIDQDPRAMLRPSVAHDLELQGNCPQLRCGGVAYFYCEFFHAALIPSTISPA